MELVRLVLGGMVAVLIAGDASSSNSINEPLPDPLTIESALGMASPDHPYLMSLEAEAVARQSRVEAASGKGVTSYLELDLRQVDKTITPETEFVDDSRVVLRIEKLLTDFGRTRTRQQAAQLDSDAFEYIRRYRSGLHQLNILSAYLDVHLADLRYNVDDELMSLSFFPYRRTRDRREKYQEFSEITERRLESEYRKMFIKRTHSGHEQRRQRNRLALAMGRPGELVSNILKPDISGYRRAVPDYPELLQEILANHPLMLAAREALTAVETEFKSVVLEQRPRLKAVFEAREYELEVGTSRDRYRAILEINFPLGSSASASGRQILATSKVMQAKADLKTLEYDIQQQVLEQVQRLELLETELRAAAVEENYRDLYVDRARTLYELELRTDLGDSQARLAEALWNLARVEYEFVRVWAKLDLMRGRKIAFLKLTQ